MRKKRTAYEALFLIEKHLLKYEGSGYESDLNDLKGFLEKEEFLEVGAIKEELEKDFNSVILEKSSKEFYNTQYEELAQIIFKVSQFEHFDKHNAVGAVYPVAFTRNDEAGLTIEIIPNIDNQKDAENIKKEIDKIYKDIAEEFEKAKIKVSGMELKLRRK
jgi:hypothetical protein